MGGGEAKGKEVANGKNTLQPEKGRGKGDLLIQDLWNKGTDRIHYMHVMNTDAVYYQYKTPEKCMETAEHKKKRK